MPIHLRAEPGDYADACLLPGDPLRAKYIAETFLSDVTQVNEERGLLGYTGTWEGKRSLGAGHGNGLPRRDDRVRGADPARRHAPPPGRYVRRPAGRPRARRPDRRDLRRAGGRDRDPSRRRRAALPDRELGARPRGGARGQARGSEDPRRPDRLERPLLQPGRGAVRALVEARRARGRDGSCGAVHARSATRRPRRLPADDQRHRRRGRVRPDLRRRAARGGRAHDADRARHRNGRLLTTAASARPHVDAADPSQPDGLPRQPGLGRGLDGQALARDRAPRRCARPRRRRTDLGRPGRARRRSRPGRSRTARRDS